MSEKTNIEWATSTGNPWIGCTKVSPGCKNCYAAEMDENRFSKTMGGGTKEKPVSHWGKGAPRVRTKAFWEDALKWDEIAAHEAARDAYDGQRITRPRIFPSLCDWLDDEVPIEWLADFLKLIHDTPNLDWLLLTKRPENWREHVDAVRDAYCSAEYSEEQWRSFYDTREACREWVEKENPPANVWFGVSVEDQKRADERIPLLLRIPAKVRFLSVEPLLERIQIDKNRYGTNLPELPIDWVIVGGESGKDRRDCGWQAIRDVAEQCYRVHVPVFVKQDCAFKPGQQGRIPNEIWALKQFPK